MAQKSPPHPEPLTEDGQKLSTTFLIWLTDLSTEVNDLRNENTALKARVDTLEGS